MSGAIVMSFNVPSTVVPCCDVFPSPDGTIIYFTGKHCTTIHQANLDVKNKPKPKLIYAHQLNPKSIIEIAGAIHGTSQVDVVWKDPTSDRVCFINSRDIFHPQGFRFSQDSNSLDMLDIVDAAKGVPFALSDGTPALWERLKETNQNLVHLLELRGTKIEISETITLPSNIAFNFSRTHGMNFSYPTCAFDRGGDGTCYALASDARLYQRVPGETNWKHIAGVGGSTNRPRSETELPDGVPLTLELTSWMSISAGPNGDVLLCDGSDDRNFYVTKDGKSSYLFQHHFGSLRPISIRWSYADPSYCYISGRKTILKVKVPEDLVEKAKASAEIQALSTLFHSHPEVSDDSVTLKDGSKLYLHRCILSARCPQFLAWLKTATDVSDSTLKTTLRYIYDADVPSDVRNEIAPLEWIPLAQVASALSLKELADRCLNAFGRALFYADPEVCISTLIGVAKRKENAAYLSVVKKVILERPEILVDRAHLLMEHPDLLAWFTSNLALKLTKVDKHHHTRIQNTLKELGLEFPNDDIERKRYSSDMMSLLDYGILTDMVLGGVPCHRAVLIPRCEFVATALSSGFVEQKSFVINLSDDRITEAVVRRLLRYLYTMSATSKILGEDVDELADILELADFLQLHSHVHLIEYCETRVHIHSEKTQAGTSKSKQRQLRERRDFWTHMPTLANNISAEESSQDGIGAVDAAIAHDDDDDEAPQAPKRRKR